MAHTKLTLLGGWGLGENSLHTLNQCLQQHIDSRLIALPDLTRPDWQQQLLQHLPAYGWLAGWSLGGMLAINLAANFPQRVAGVITLASNACFTARKGWPDAMSPAVFNAFRQSIASSPESTLKKFLQLCVQGDANPRQLSRQLSILQSTAFNRQQLDSGLQLLQTLDNRAAIHTFSGRQLHILAQQDALVPHAAAIAMQRLNSAADIETYNGSHAFVLSAAQLLAERIRAFILSPGQV